MIFFVPRHASLSRSDLSDCASECLLSTGFNTQDFFSIPDKQETFLKLAAICLSHAIVIIQQLSNNSGSSNKSKRLLFKYAAM